MTFDKRLIGLLQLLTKAGLANTPSTCNFINNSLPLILHRLAPGGRRQEQVRPLRLAILQSFIFNTQLGN